MCNVVFSLLEPFVLLCRVPNRVVVPSERQIKKKGSRQLTGAVTFAIVEHISFPLVCRYYKVRCLLSKIDKATLPYLVKREPVIF
jgi:hypothetical protein